MSKKKEVAVLKGCLLSEFKFIRNIFNAVSVPEHMRDDAKSDVDDFVYLKKQQQQKQQKSCDNSSKRAQSLEELQQRLDKMKGTKSYSVKNKLMKKSLQSKAKKLSKQKLKKRIKGQTIVGEDIKTEIKEQKPNVNEAKPVFNSEGKMVFSKFDFSDLGQKHNRKSAKDPKKILEDLKHQQEKVETLKQVGDVDKAFELKDKIAWRNALAKVTGEKVKDDPGLLKKSIKRKEARKKQSKKKWEERIHTVEQKKEDRQKKRQENIKKKKQEKKSKKMKTATKKGRVFI